MEGRICLLCFYRHQFPIMFTWIYFGMCFARRTFTCVLKRVFADFGELTMVFFIKQQHFKLTGFQAEIRRICCMINIWWWLMKTFGAWIVSPNVEWQWQSSVRSAFEIFQTTHRTKIGTIFHEWNRLIACVCVSAVSVYILPDTFWCIHAFCVIIFRCFFFCLGIWLLLRCTMTNVLAFTHIANRMRPCM